MQLIRKVIDDYSDDAYYHKAFVFYYMEIIAKEFCNSWPEGYT